MPGTGNYVGTNVNSDYIFDVAVALTQLQDNTTELIVPKDIRDSVWTLWNRIDDVQIIASQSVGSSVFINANPTTIAVGGIAEGTTFGASQSLQQMFDKLLYPYTAPVLGLTASNTPRQYGSALTTNLDWSVIKKAQTILTITVNGNTETITGGGNTNQSGTRVVTATHSLNYNSLTNETQTFTMTVTDATQTTTKTTSINWRHKMYWGKVNLSAAVPSNPNLTTTPGAASSVASICTDSLIRALSGAGSGSGNALATGYARTFTNLNAAGDYLIIAFPTVFGTSPTFVAGGFVTNAFTKVRSASAFVTDTGITVNYDVWVSDTPQNSPISTFEIK